MHNGLRPVSPAHGSGHLQRTTSHELLTAHPLLNSGPSTGALNISTSPSSSSSHAPQQDLGRTATTSSTVQAPGPAGTAPKYLPYTPRQARVVTGSATTGTASSPVSAAAAHIPQQTSGSGGSAATSRLQLQNLKAVAQHHALDTGSLGWALLEELVGGADPAPAWLEAWNALAVGKVNSVSSFTISGCKGPRLFSSMLLATELSLCIVLLIQCVRHG